MAQWRHSALVEMHCLPRGSRFYNHYMVIIWLAASRSAKCRATCSYKRNPHLFIAGLLNCLLVVLMVYNCLKLGNGKNGEWHREDSKCGRENDKGKLNLSLLLELRVNAGNQSSSRA
jgi:hypothetical protein